MSVAHCYSNGKGVDVDFEKAYNYHKMAADKGMISKTNIRILMIICASTSSHFSAFSAIFNEEIACILFIK